MAKRQKNSKPRLFEVRRLKTGEDVSKMKSSKRHLLQKIQKSQFSLFWRPQEVTRAWFQDDSDMCGLSLNLETIIRI